MTGFFEWVEQCLDGYNQYLNLKLLVLAVFIILLALLVFVSKIPEIKSRLKENLLFNNGFHAEEYFNVGTKKYTRYVHMNTTIDESQVDMMSLRNLRRFIKESKRR